ncbi:cation diffusion facilitator family transporter [Peribacillus sp. JNUCC 23]
MGHNHGHSHGHSHGSGNKKALFMSFLIITSFMVVEVIGGIVTNSLALLSDAGHMLSDSAAMGLSLAAIKLGERKASSTHTFGYRRSEIIAASINGITLMAISLYIFYEAYQRLMHPPEVQSMGMLLISVLGLIVNIIAAAILMRADKDTNLNVRSAFFHVLGDMLGSVGAIVAALLIMFFGWGIADPIASIIVAILIIISGWRVTKESFHVLMEGTPSQIDIQKVKNTLQSIPKVENVHDLHIWSITSEVPMLSCHIEFGGDGNHDAILHQAQKILHDEFGFEHSTIQVENADQGCANPHGTCDY